MNLFIFITFCAFLANATAQYYYVGQPAVYHIPPTYNTFSHPFSTYHVNPNFQQFRTVPAPQYRALPAPTPPAPVQRTAFTQNNDPEYRGFAYHTRTDSGATSHVLFVTGPQAQQVNSRVFNNFDSPVFGQNYDARTIASEMIDPVKKTEQEKANVLPKSIQDLYAPPAMQKVENNDPFQYFQSVFQNPGNPSNRLINFYSRNTDLFAEQVPGYPANVVPLSYNAINPRFLNTESNSTLEINQSNNSTESTTTKNASENEKSGEVAAESIITNTRFKLNEITEQTYKTNIGNPDENQSSSLSSAPAASDPSTIIFDISSATLSTSDGIRHSAPPVPSDQRATTHSEGPSSTSNTDSSVPTTSISSSAEDSPMSSNATINLYLKSPLNGIITTSPSTIIGSKSLSEYPSFSTQRLGNQPRSLALMDNFLNDMPSSSASSSELSISDNLVLTSQKSSPLSNGTLGQALNTLMGLSSSSLYFQTPQDLKKGTILHLPVSAFNVTETVSSSGFLRDKMAGVTISILANTSSSGLRRAAAAPASSSSSSVSASTTIYSSSDSDSIIKPSSLASADSSTSLISKELSSNPSSDSSISLSEENSSTSYSAMIDEITTEINNTTARATSLDVDTTTNEVQLTTNYSDDDTRVLDVIETKTFESNSEQALLVDSSLDETNEGGTAPPTAGNSNEENITTENILFTTDAMMTTASQ